MDINLYERYEKIRDARGYTDYKVSKLAGIGTATISNWKNGKYTPKFEKLNSFAKALDVSYEYLIGENDFTVCSVCGFGDNPLSEESRKEHEEFHNKFLDAKEKYPFLAPYSESDTVKERCFVLIRDNSADLAERLENYENYLQAQFSIECSKRGYKMSHFEYTDFCKSYTISLNLESSVYFSDDFVNAVFEKYHIDRNYLHENQKMIARISENEQIMKILRYMEDLKPEHLDALEIQIKALSGH